MKKIRTWLLFTFCILAIQPIELSAKKEPSNLVLLCSSLAILIPATLFLMRHHIAAMAYHFDSPYPLIKAAYNGAHPAVLEKLLASANIDQKDYFHETALYRAAEKKHLEIVEFLVQNGANINQKDNLGRTALHRAAAENHLETVKILVQNGANIDQKDDFHETALRKAAANNHLEIVKFLLQNGASINSFVLKYLMKNGIDIHQKNTLGENLLHGAVRGKNITVIELLLDLDLKINQENNLGETPLDLAVLRDSKELVKLLIEHGACLKKNHAAALIFAAENDLYNFTQTLLKDKINIDDKTLKIALGKAVANRNLAIIKIFVKNRAAIIDQDILNLATDLEIKQYLNKKRFFTKSNTFFRSYVISELAKNNPITAQENLKIMLHQASSCGTTCANRFYDTICANFTEEKRKNFGFTYQNVRDLYLDLVTYTKRKHWFLQKGWLDTCFTLCKGPIFDNSYHGDFESSVRSTVEKLFDNTRQKEIRKNYEKNFLFYQNMHTLVKPQENQQKISLKIPIIRMPKIVVSEDKNSAIHSRNNFLDMGIKLFTKKEVDVNPRLAS